MIHTKSLLLVTSILFIVKSHAQSITRLNELLGKKKEIIYGFDNRRTHILRQHTVIYGVYTGIGIGKKLRLKVGMNGTPFEVGKLIDQNSIIKKSRLLFVSLGEEYDFYQYKKFGMTSYLQAGAGRNYYRKLNTSGIAVGNGKELIIPIEAGLHFSYDLLSYLKLKTGGGWRFVTPNYSRDLSGYYVKLGLNFSYKQFMKYRAASSKQK